MQDGGERSPSIADSSFIKICIKPCMNNALQTFIWERYLNSNCIKEQIKSLKFGIISN